MSRIAKGLALTSVAAAAVAGTAGVATADSEAKGFAAHSPGVRSTCAGTPSTSSVC